MAQRRDCRFPHRLRLTRGADFDAVFKDGRRSSDRLFTVLYRSSGHDHARLGMTASAKRVPTAVARNRIRRIIRDSFRHARADLAGLDIVVVVRDAAAAAPRPELHESLAAHWSRLRRAASRPQPEA